MEDNGRLDDRVGASSFTTTFHPRPLNPFAAAHGGTGQKRAADGSFVSAGGASAGSNQLDAHHTNGGGGMSSTEAAASSSPPAAAALSPTNPDGKKPKKTAPKAEHGVGGDGATIEVVRRPRGRPPGSKNRPKPPPAVLSGGSAGAPSAAGPDTGEHVACAGASVMRPHIFEVPAGHDIADSLAAFCRHRDFGVSVLAATGPVSNVTLRQPLLASSSPSTSVVTFHGRFDLLSISATFFPPSFGAATPLLPPTASGTVAVSVAGPHGHIIGGAVAGPLIAAGTVTVIAATFGCPSYHRLPLQEDDLSVSVSVSTGPAGDTSSGGPVGRAADYQVDQAPPAAVHSQHEYGHHHPQQQHSNHRPASHPDPAVVTSLPIPTSHLLSDVIWAPRDRITRPF